VSVHNLNSAALRSNPCIAHTFPFCISLYHALFCPPLRPNVVLQFFSPDVTLLVHLNINGVICAVGFVFYCKFTLNYNAILALK
jgi:hypothetical protein